MQTTLPTTDDWERIDSKAHEAMDGSRRDGVAADNIMGWRNAETEEAVVIQPLRDHHNADDVPDFGAYWYAESGYSDAFERYKIAKSQRLLFRAASLTEAEERISEWIEAVETPEDAGDRHTSAINPQEIRRHELSHVTSLEDWAHLTGADYYTGEKVGNTKQSTGNVAMFEGNTRHGEGAYVALARVDGPDGDEYASIGVENGGYYTADRRLGSGRRGSFALEIRHPIVEYDGETIHIESGRHDTDTSITITAQTGNPTVNLCDPE